MPMPGGWSPAAQPASNSGTYESLFGEPQALQTGGKVRKCRYGCPHCGCRLHQGAKLRRARSVHHNREQLKHQPGGNVKEHRVLLQPQVRVRNWQASSCTNATPERVQPVRERRVGL